jgi:hypothetical protein
MTPEGKIKEEVKIFLKSLGPDCWYFCPMMMGYGRKGIPDFMGCYKGHFFSIETKSKNGKISPWQQREHEAIIDAGGAACFLWTTSTIETVKNWFESWGYVDE